MAQKVSVLLVDDLDGTEAHETVSFALDGAAYEIDLSKENAEDLRLVMARFVEAARSVGKPKRNRKSTANDGRPATKLVREWAREVGIEVPSRGTISADVIAQYEAAH